MNTYYQNRPTRHNQHTQLICKEITFRQFPNDNIYAVVLSDRQGDDVKVIDWECGGEYDEYYWPLEEIMHPTMGAPIPHTDKRCSALKDAIADIYRAGALFFV